MISWAQDRRLELIFDKNLDTIYKRSSMEEGWLIDINDCWI